MLIAMKTPSVFCLVAIAFVLALNLFSCQEHGSFKEASTYNSQLDSTYDHTIDSFLLHSAFNIGDSLSLPALAELENAVMLKGFSRGGGFSYECIISGDTTQKIQLLYKDLLNADTNDHYKYQERVLSKKEYGDIVEFMLDKEIVNLPFSLEHRLRPVGGNGYVLSLKEKDFIKSTYWQIIDFDNEEKKDAIHVFKEILRIADYPPPIPFARLMHKETDSFEYLLGAWDQSLITDYEVYYQGKALEKEDSTDIYEITVPLKDVPLLKDQLRYTGYLSNGKKIALEGIVIDSSRYKTF
jgi:hypothetical protein